MLIIKPNSFYIYTQLQYYAALLVLLYIVTITSTIYTSSIAIIKKNKALKIKINIYYSFNINIYKQLASQLTNYIVDYSFIVSIIGILNTTIKGLLKKNLIILIAILYNSQLASNIVQFIGQISTLQSNKLARVVFTLFSYSYYN